MTETPRPDYGIDAPGVIRNLLVIGVLLLAVRATVGSVVRFGQVAIDFSGSLLLAGVICVAEGALMLVYSMWGKFRHRDRMLARHAWRGDERVLDVGTGRGLLLVGAARRLTRGGKAVGIDIWRAEDLSGNTIEATRRNLALEGVADRCELRTMSADRMEFDDGSFDVVVSNLCLHNIYDRTARERACREIARVLGPGGVGLISDYRHTADYARVFRDAGCETVLAPRWLAAALTTFPPLRIVHVRKGPADAGHYVRTERA